MSDPNSFPTLMRKLTAGDADAAAAVFEQYASALIRLARKHLEERVRSKVGAEDMPQSVFRTFFRRARQGQFDLAHEGALWALLAAITVRKCGRWNRHFRTHMRSTTREVPLAEELAVPAGAPEPTPDEAAALADLVETLLRGLDERERAVCELRLQGYTAPEIAARVNCSRVTVFRDLDRIKERLEALLPPDAG
jgi:RNA polymerase sigma-70 factor, ECF subfamily